MLENSNIFDADGTDELFNALKNEIRPWGAAAKRTTQHLWGKTHSYLDSDLANQLRSQFHQRFWEMYLVAALLEVGKELEPGRSEGPDICIKSDDLSKIWVEAVAALPGTGADAVQRALPNVVRSVPNEQIKLRLLTVFDTKFRQFKKHREKNIILEGEPYIIAINAAQVPSARLDGNVPNIIGALLPFGNLEITINKQTLKAIESGYTYQGSISKESGKPIPTNSFLNPEYAGISAIIYSTVDAINLPEELCRGLLLFHNPIAQNPLPFGFLRCGYEYWVDGIELKNKNWDRDRIDS